MGASALVSDRLVNDGFVNGKPNDIRLGAELFPWNRFIRTKLGYYVILHAPPSQGAVAVLLDALRRDPYSADLTYGLALHYYVLGDHGQANLAFARFAQLAHNSPLGHNVAKALEAIR